ncbi:hypothetical protein H9L13_05610 [Sphingomonas lutea]|uniref:DUF2306 domain-containing protein n=1 Tax=Sphingomonas lutea TaxID=1045317 RepID=A0A7G9SKG5_9SPHN|nr:hypothetical protein [Sphingomonas lutea]QNN68340.1 hypothetical protein H9L13_05610 [Sphingomonas lutea]
MPYRHAHWYLLALFPFIGLAFWPQYLSQITTASMELHAHGITATLWLILMIAQSWTMARGQRDTHRSLGALSLVLFPLFMAGGASIFMGMADRFAMGLPFHVLFAAKLAWLDIVAVGGFAFFFFEALRLRRKVHPHAGYMLATVIFLIPPIFGRLSAIPLGIGGPEDLPRLEIGFQAANLLAAGIAFFVAYRRRPHGRPFAIAGLLTILASILFAVIGGSAAWQDFYARLAPLPTAPFALAAGLAGVAIAYAGWVAGKRSGPPRALPA